MSSCKERKERSLLWEGVKLRNAKRAHGILAAALAFVMATTSVLPARASEVGGVTPLSTQEEAATPVVLYKEDFEYSGTTADYFVAKWTSPQGIAVASKTGTEVKAAADGGNKVLNITGTAGDGKQPFQTDARWGSEAEWKDATSFSDKTGKSVVYELKFKLKDTPSGYVAVKLRSVKEAGGGAFVTLYKIENNVLKITGASNTTLSTGEYHKIAAVCNFDTGKQDVYLDGALVADDVDMPLDAGFNVKQVNDYIRFDYWKAVDTDILLDDLAVYESIVPVDNMFPAKDNTTEPTPDEPAEPTIIYKENFQSASGSYITNKAYGVAIPGAAYGTAAAYKDSDDNYAMRLTYDGTGNELQANVRWSDASAWDDNAADCNMDMTNKKVVYEYAIKLISDAENTFYAVLGSNNGGTKTSSMFSVKNNTLTFDNIEADAISMTKGTWYRLSMIYDYAAGTRTVYVNGTSVGSGAILGFASLDVANMTDMVRFTTQGLDKTVTADFLVDNMVVYESDKLLDISFESEGDEENIPQVATKEGYEIYTTDFEISNPFTTSGTYESTISWEYENDSNTVLRSGSNKVLRFERLKQHHFHADLQGVAKEAGSIVYEFKIKLLNAAETAVTMQLKDKNANYTNLCAVNAGNLTNGSNSVSVGTLTENEWATISVIQNYNTRTKEIYLNGVKVAEGQAIAAGFGNGADASILRVWVGDITAAVEEHKDSFMIDDIRIYQGTQLHDELTEDTVTITIDNSTSIFEKTDLLTKSSVLKDMMNGYISLHTRNGMVYQNGVKALLGSGTREVNGKYYVVAREICEVLGTSYAENGETATINGQQATVTKQDEKLWVEAEYFFTTLLGKKVVTDTKAKSSGMMVAGDAEFTFPSEVPTSDNVFFARSVLQDLNDFLFFERPSASEIQAAYEVSASYQQHPRIQITAEDVVAIKNDIQTNSLKQEWYGQLMAVADYLVEENTAALKYELRDGVRLLQVARDMLERMYVLGMAYQLTGEQKYVDRAWVDWEAVSNFPDWHPTHDLDPAEMSAAVAIGYDWMYDALTEAQRRVIEKGIYKLCFQDAISAYNLGSAPIGSAVLSGINHNIVLNGGFAMGAMAFADVYPEVCNYIISGAITASDIMLTEWGPDGAWKEGPTYWEYAMDYTVKMFSSLETMFGTCFSLDDCEGLSTAANYMLNLQSDIGSFNYGDGSASSYYVPEMFYLSNKYGDASVTSTVLSIKHGKMVDVEDMIHSLMCYDTSIREGEAEMPLDSAFYGEGVATFRDEWTDGVTAFAAIHGGITRLCHAQVDAGTFIYDYAGIRWATELGSTPYDTAVTAEYGLTGRRWLLYRSMAEAHNTIVINPKNGDAGQKLDATARLTKVDSKEKGAIAVMDLTESYSENASSAIRGMFFTDDRTSLVVRDEISLKNADSTVYWFMQTGTEVEISDDGTYAMLSQEGKQVRLDFVTSGNGTATLGVGPSTRALLGTTSPITTTSTSSGKYDQEDADKNRIYIKLEDASGDVAITVKLTPVGVNATDVADYNKAISSWTIPDGAVAEKPTLEATKLKVTIDGREVEFDDNNDATFLCVAGKYEEAPEAVVTVDEKYTYTITNADRVSGGTITVTVKEKDNEAVYTTFAVHLEEIPVAKIPDAAPAGFAEKNALQVIAAKASAEPEKLSNGYVAWKVLDQDTNSRWTSQGIGNWILLELEETSVVDDMLILFKNGHIRSTFFNISVSEDGVNYTQVFTGKSGGTAIGSAEAYEQFSLGGVSAKYIKIGCNGNTAQGMTGWNNIGEVVFVGNTPAKPTGYTAGISAQNKKAEVDDIVYIPVSVSYTPEEGGQEETGFHAAELKLSYDGNVLEFVEEKSTLGNATVVSGSEGSAASGETAQTDAGMILTLEDYGASKNFGTNVYVLAFKAIKDAESTEVTLTGAGFTNKEDAVSKDLTPAALSPSVVTLEIVKKALEVEISDTLFKGEKKAAYGADYTFSLADDGAYFDYKEITATIDGAPATVTKNENGTYTVKNVTGKLVISCEGRTPKTYDVTFTGKPEDEINKAMEGVADEFKQKNATYGTVYQFRLPAATIGGWVYELGSVTAGGASVAYTSKDGVYTIAGTDVKGDIVITINRKENMDVSVTINAADNGASADCGGNAATAEKNKPYTLTVTPEAGYTYEVTATMGDKDVTLTKESTSDGKLTYKIEKVIGNIVFTVTKKVDTSGITVTEYLTLNAEDNENGLTMWLVENTTAVAAKKVPTYNGEKMFWSVVYGKKTENTENAEATAATGAYCYLVISSQTEEEVLAAVKAALGIADGTATTVAYDGDVNMTQLIDASDAQLVWNMYNASYSDFTTVSVEKFLRADVNGDKKVNVADAAKVIDTILGND